MGSRPELSTAEYRNLLESAHAMADASGEVLVKRFRKRLAVENKATGISQRRPFDPVTAADKASERAIARVLKTRHPHHGMLGEEYGAQRSDARFQWVIDPIDGTRAFIVGMPTWGTLIGLNDRGVPVLGVMDQPYIGERFWADRAQSRMRAADGALRRIRTRPCASLAGALAMTTSPDLFEGDERSAMEDLRARVRMVRYGGDCYAYCMLAAGHVDLVVESGLQPYDIVALVPIIERAGGRVTTWAGGHAAGGGQIVAAGDPRLHDLVLRHLEAAALL
jgi:myo-inositol-1(or 4)-monophosphatase